MDYDSHLRAMQQHPSLCNVVNFAASTTTETGDSATPAAAATTTTTNNATSSIMALMTDHHHNHHNQQHSHHNLNSSENNNNQDLRDVNHFSGSILNPASAGANLSPAANYNPDYHHHPNSALEPYLQTALYQAQGQAQPHRQQHHHHHHHHHSSYSSHGYSEEDTKPELVSAKQMQDYSNNNNSNSNNNLGAGLLSPGAANSTCTQDAITAAAARAGDCIHHDNISVNEHQPQQPDPIRAKIVSHPIYPRLVLAYLNCNKIGAPPEVSTKLDEVGKKYQNFRSPSPVSIGSDPDLDQFMETYCSVLQKYHEELTQPFKEAMAFFRKIELQLNALSKGSLRTPQSAGAEGKADAGNNNNDATINNVNATNTNSNSNNDNMEFAASSDEEEGDGSCGEVDFHDDNMASSVDPLAEDQKLKEQLLRKYSGYISSLKQEFLKKKKKGKLPKEARQKLLDWWTLHYKWPYPSEAEKAALAESTGLDQKQINNWFINQRKRHWKPSEDMQYVMVDSPHHHHLGQVTAAHGIPSTGLGTYHHMDAMEAAAAAASIMPMHP